MRSVKEQMDDFRKLDSEQKKDIIVNMLEILKTKDEDFKNIYEKMQLLKIWDDDLMDTIYEEVAIGAEKSRAEKKELQIGNIGKLKNKIDLIRQQEQEEQKNNNPDDLLDNI